MCNQERTDNNAPPVHNRDSKMQILEWWEIITSGIYPSEQQLEHMLDRIEGTP